jgi:hypothetical protein
MAVLRLSGRYSCACNFIIPRRNTMYDTLIISALENAFLNDGDITHELEDELKRHSLPDMSAPLDLSPYSLSDIFTQ